MSDRTHTPHPIAVIVGLTLLMGLVLSAFALPAVKSSPHDIPIGVAGPAPATAQITTRLNQTAPGAFTVTPYPDETALATAIRAREVYGGIAASPTGATVLTAPAASPVVAQTLTSMAAGLSRTTGREIPVKIVVPLPENDSRGAGLAASMLPLVIGAIVPVIAFTRLVRGRWTQLAWVLGTAVALGATLVSLLHWYGVLGGNWALEAGAMTLAIAASSALLLGLNSLAGTPGLGLGAATIVLLGNPLSGAASAPEFLAQPWQGLGQALPPGAGSQLLRSAAYFDGAGANRPLLVLCAWFVGGLALVLVAQSRRTSAAAPVLTGQAAAGT